MNTLSAPERMSATGCPGPYLPCFGVITDGKVADVKVAQWLEFGAGTIVVDDRGYNDYRLFGQWCDEDVFFVTRMKRDALYEVVEERQPPRNRGIVSDQTIRLNSAEAHDKCPHLLRRVEAVREDTGETLVFLSDLHHLGAITIAPSWLNRVECLFRAISENRIKRDSFTSVAELELAIDLYIADHNAHPKPFIWTVSASDILAKVTRAKAAVAAVTSTGLS